MKLLLTLLLFVFSLKSYAQNGEDAIIGSWLKTPKNDLIINVYKQGVQYNGKIAWAKDSSRNKAAGFVILENLKYDTSKKMWNGGSITDPESGKTYNAEATIKGDGTLELRAYMGLKFLGTKKYFKRAENP